MKRTIPILLCAAGALAAARAAEPPAAPDTALAGRGTLVAAWADSFRRTAATNAAALPNAFEPAAAARWADGPARELTAVLQADFFAGAHVLLGPFGETDALVAFHNPFWDALLFVETGGGYLPGSPDKAGSFRPGKVIRFRWIDGETFRGSTVAPGGPFALGVLRAQAATVRRFDERFPDADGPAFLDDAALGVAPADGDAAAWTRILDGPAVRLRAGLALATNRMDRAVAGRCEELLRRGSAPVLRRHFADGAHARFRDSFLRLPPALREGFSLYGYVPGEDGALFLFVNEDVPRLFATVSMPRGRTRDAASGEPAFEWYDLREAARYLKAVREAGKEDPQ